MLVKKSVFKEINKEGFQRFHSRFQGLNEDQKGSIAKFRQPSKLADKVNKVWENVVLYEFPLSLNPGDKPNDA